MSEVPQHRSDNPAPVTGRDFIYTKNKLTELAVLGRGQQGMVYRGVFETRDHKKQAMVIKDFAGKDIAIKEGQCRFVSQTAAIFREAGLPVLPIVKSVTTTKDIHDLRYCNNDIEMASMCPPYVVMSFLPEEESDKITHALEFKKDRWELFDLFEKNPELGEGLVSDLATIHALGYTRSLGEWVIDETELEFLPHPIESLWLFTKNKTDGLDRWLVDLSNLARVKDLSSEDLLKTNPTEDANDLIFLLTYTAKLKKRESELKELYEKFFDEETARRNIAESKYFFKI